MGGLFTAVQCRGGRLRVEHFICFQFQISRLEVSDEEWEEEMAEAFRSSGILSQGHGILTSIPKGLVNVNFDTHACVHMGTHLRSTTCSEKPTSVSYPIDLTTDNQAGQLYTLIMLDLDHQTSPYLHWMVTNIPEAKVDLGHTIAEYQTPIPNPGSGPHRYIILAMKQKSGEVQIDLDEDFAQLTSCDSRGRSNFDLAAFKGRYKLAEPTAANYFQIAYDKYVQDIQNFCRK